jgi:hypothetical protein
VVELLRSLCDQAPAATMSVSTGIGPASVMTRAAVGTNFDIVHTLRNLAAVALEGPASASTSANRLARWP